MNEGFGIEPPRPHSQQQRRQAARFLVVIDAGGSAVARLVQADGELVAEFDAGTEEAARMTQGRAPVIGAEGPQWDRALEGHSAAERAAAAIYTLDV